MFSGLCMPKRLLTRWIMMAVMIGLAVHYGSGRSTAESSDTSGPEISPAVSDAVVPSFVNDVVPILTRYDCNSGGCHGKLAGRNGFKLSLRGFAPESDFESLTREGRGRRLNPAAPLESLLIAKANGSVPHGGGQRFAPNSLPEQVLKNWIAAGTPGPLTDEPRVNRVDVEPASAQLRPGEHRQLRVIAWYRDGSSRDVTWLTQFASGDAGLLAVDEAGKVTALRHGENVVRVSFQGEVGVATFTMPHETEVDPQWYAVHNNEIDAPVFARLQALQIEPSPLCDDATFLRRAMLDAVGTLPTPEEVRLFLADAHPDKRERMIDKLLARPEFVDYWSLQLGDLLQNRVERDHDVRGKKGVRSFHQWIRQQLIEGRNWRQIASDVLLAKGACTEHPAVGYFIVTVGEKSSEESEVADSVAQAFLGTRIGCARCHNHPLEKFTQDDYYHFVSFFSRLALDRKPSDQGVTQLLVSTRHLQNLEKQLQQQQEKRTELQQQLQALVTQTTDTQNGAAEQVQAKQKEVDEVEKRIADLGRQIEQTRLSPVTVRQPRTGQQLLAQPPDRSPIEIVPGRDPREPFVRWMTDPANRYFSGAMVNRLWKHFLGTGLVEPVDDLRATNPPSNQELWELLNREFVRSDYDLKHLMRLIMNSRTYQLSAETRPTNFRDARFYSHAQARRLPAEVLLDAICFATDDPEQFQGYPLGIRAIQVPDPGTDSYFLNLFGRSQRVTACACERSGDVTLPQLLHLQNNDGLSAKIQSPNGRLERLLRAEMPVQEIVTELFLATVSRQPTDAERAAITKQLIDVPATEPAPFLQDLFWALLNSKEFAFQH
ncbi:MAG: DUF1553 domain-containing protein [Planctomycetaceae bacterium]